VRTRPITAHALPAWVIGSRFLGGFPSRMMARDPIGHAPSSRWVFTVHATDSSSSPDSGQGNGAMRRNRSDRELQRVVKRVLPLVPTGHAVVKSELEAIHATFQLSDGKRTSYVFT
jgi:hypothetical protein